MCVTKCLIIFVALSTKSVLPISRILKMMELEQVGRNYYNKREATEFRDHKLVSSRNFHIMFIIYTNLYSIDSQMCVCVCVRK